MSDSVFDNLQKTHEVVTEMCCKCRTFRRQTVTDCRTEAGNQSGIFQENTA